MPDVELVELNNDEHRDQRRNPERLAWFRRLMLNITGKRRADGEQLELDDKQVDQMEIPEVQTQLRGRQLDTTGNGPKLKARLKEALAVGREYRSQGRKRNELDFFAITFDRFEYTQYVGTVTDTLAHLASFHDRYTMVWENFYDLKGKLTITLVHIAAHTGNLLMLRNADEANMNAEDPRGRRAMHYAAFAGHKHIVEWLLDQPGTRDQLLHLDHQGNSPLHSAILGLQYNFAQSSEEFDSSCRQNVDVVELLLYEGAEVDSINNFGFSPLFTLGHVLTINGGPNKVRLYEKVFKILVNASASVHTKPDKQNTTVLYHAAELGSIEATRHLIKSRFHIVVNEYENTTILHSAARCESHEILKILLDTCRDIDSSFFRQPDGNGMTPLHYAAKTGHPKNFSALIHNGANPLTKNREGMTAFHVLFEECSDPIAYLTDVLDSQVRFRTTPTIQRAHLNFRLLQRPGRSEMDVILTLINAAPTMKEKTILQHPLLETFFKLKRSDFRYFFFILCILHICFLFFLFWYAIVLLQNDAGSSLPRRLLLPCAFVLLANNAIQVLTTPNFDGKAYKTGLYPMYNFCCNYYDRHFGHWLSIICELMSIGMAVAGEFIPEVMTTVSTEYPDTRPRFFWQPEPWLLNSVSIVIFLAGIQMMVIIGTFPPSGYYILMFSAVLKNVLKVFLVFVWLILSFAFSFMILFRDENQFHDSWVAVVKTVAMMTGEYDYSALLTINEKDNSTVNNLDSKKTSLPIMGGIIFLIFVILANIVMMNLITALAVTEDVIGLAKKAELLGLIKQAELVGHFDRMATLCRFKWIKTEIWQNTIVYAKHPDHMRKDGSPGFRYISKGLMNKLSIVTEKNLKSDKRTEISPSWKEPEDNPTDFKYNLQNQIRHARSRREYRRRRNICCTLSRDNPFIY